MKKVVCFLLVVVVLFSVTFTSSAVDPVTVLTVTKIVKEGVDILNGVKKLFSGDVTQVKISDADFKRIEAITKEVVHKGVLNESIANDLRDFEAKYNALVLGLNEYFSLRSALAEDPKSGSIVGSGVLSFATTRVDGYVLKGIGEVSSIELLARESRILMTHRVFLRNLTDISTANMYARAVGLRFLVFFEKFRLYDVSRAGVVAEMVLWVDKLERLRGKVYKFADSNFEPRTYKAPIPIQIVPNSNIPNTAYGGYMDRKGTYNKATGKMIYSSGAGLSFKNDCFNSESREVLSTLKKFVSD
jgi:hypothetical protein